MTYSPSYAQVRLQDPKDNAAKCIMMAMMDNHLLSTIEDYWGSDTQVVYQHLVADYASHALGFDVCENDEWVSYTNKATAEEINNFAINKMISEFSPHDPDDDVKVYVAVFDHDRFLGALSGTKFAELGDIEKSGHYSPDEIEQIKALEKEQGTVGGPADKLVFRII